jgi:hypothetical protein
MVDVDAHVVLAVLVKHLSDVLVCGTPTWEPVAIGVGVAFVEASDSMDYCINFHR